MKKDEARQHILRLFDWWVDQNCSKKPPSGTDAFGYFAWLETERPDLLNFRNWGDKWQTVHGWLLRAGKVAD